MVVDRPLQSPPSYEEATCSNEEQSIVSGTEPSISYQQLSAMLNDLRIDIEQSSATLVLLNCDHAQLFFILSNGQVTSPSQKSSLKIFKLEGKLYTF